MPLSFNFERPAHIRFHGIRASVLGLWRAHRCGMRSVSVCLGLYFRIGSVWVKGFVLSAEAGGICVSHFVWADNVILVAGSLPMLTSMIVELSQPLYLHGFHWKASGLEFMNIARDDTDPLVVHLFSFSGSSGNCPSSALVFKRVSALKILGAVIDRNFTDHEDIRHRMRCAVGPFSERTNLIISRVLFLCIRRFAALIREFAASSCMVWKGLLLMLVCCGISTRRKGRCCLAWSGVTSEQMRAGVVFLSRLFYRGRQALFRERKASLVQLCVYKQWMWAKDVVSTCFFSASFFFPVICCCCVTFHAISICLGSFTFPAGRRGGSEHLGGGWVAVVC
mmetsp:Transcript_85430/g.241851  ORF Transcript_85430/g.241851 Transcript_85430/m.241851 type:complete len:337 (-) Transcript_85430:352-1362(-)